ncbi:hypothetical protein BH20VER2_BH20VER2_15950 [soil metagenome]
MTSAEIRQSFLDFFREKQHTIVPSSSLLPDAPNLLFTNAGMNQFVPIFLAQQPAPWSPPRTADTQKCIRAGGKHNDLDDVGLDTYHHTFFEMLGNWSFGDYFKKEAIDWAWELVVERWGLPPQRLYATVYKPGEGEPSEFDQEAYDHWARLFTKAGLDPAVQIVNGNKKDNFWMMGDTGPCGPCSELHVDLTPAGDTKGALVNTGDARCIEIWNLVFIQFNANADGTFVPLPARHVDTGMGFERVCAILQGTKRFTDFSSPTSNYETDVFRPIFDEIEKLSGRRYGSTLPKPGSTGENEQEKIDVAFRVVGDHIRTLSFAIADGIQPSNESRGYVLRRILRRAVRYGRTLGFHKPFFYRLVDVLVATMSAVFPELRAKQQLVRDNLRREEEAFNRTLDKGITLFEAEVARLQAPGSARVPRAGDGVPPSRTSPAPGARYAKRRLPHFELPWAIYAVTISTESRRHLSPPDRTIVLNAFRHFHGSRYDLIAVCVMPDHVHALLRPAPKQDDEKGDPLFWTLSELMQSIKSFTAHEINKARGTSGTVWQKERFDRYIRSDRDLEEKFQYICRNPWEAGVAGQDEDYPWLWTRDEEGRESSSPPEAATSARDARATQTQQSTISGEFAFRLYDEQGFPLDLTELMARERGLTVDVAGFEKLMEEQRDRARKAQKKQTITVEAGNLQVEPTTFLGYDFFETEAVVEAVVPGKKDGELAVVLDRTSCYAEMGGQVGDHGLLHVPGHDRTEVGLLRVLDTQKRGDVFVHSTKLESGRAPEPGEAVRVSVDAARRAAIQRHHTVTHLLHWALHEVVSREAAQKGSYVGAEKLTFDFNSGALTAQQTQDVEKLVNERILENSSVSWTELPFAEVKQRPDITQFFGDKYGDVVRVVQIGGLPRELNGYSMELCGGTHVRGTGEIGLFRIVSESAIAAGVRRVEAVAGLQAYDVSKREVELIRSLAAKLNSPIADLEKRIESMLTQQKALEKSMKALEQKQAGETARQLLQKAQSIGDIPAIIENLGSASGDYLQAIAEALKQQQFKGLVVLAGVHEGAVALVASVAPDFTAKVQAGKIIQTIAPIVGGKGGGRPDSARGAGKDASKIAEALEQARALLAS